MGDNEKNSHTAIVMVMEKSEYPSYIYFFNLKEETCTFIVAKLNTKQTVNIYDGNTSNQHYYTNIGKIIFSYFESKIRYI